MPPDIETNATQWSRTHFVTQDGVIIAADVGGDISQPVVVLMHGGGQTRFSWEDTMKRLVALGYRVINYDARGHGDSGWSKDGVYTYALRAKDLAAVLETVRSPFALIGASLGGITALQAMSNGVRPAAAVLVDIVLRPERRGVERVRAFMTNHPQGFGNLEEAVQAVAAYNPHRKDPGDPNKLMRNLRLGSDGRLHWHWDPRIVPPTLAQDLDEMASMVERLEAVKDVPVLLVRGRNSDVLSDANVEDFRRYIPAAEVFEVPGAGHMVAGDSNEVFTSRAVSFLARHLPPHVPKATAGEHEFLRR